MKHFKTKSVPNTNIFANIKNEYLFNYLIILGKSFGL